MTEEFNEGANDGSTTDRQLANKTSIRGTVANLRLEPHDARRYQPLDWLWVADYPPFYFLLLSLNVG